MKTDPNACAATLAERRGWALVHDALAHPLMALSLYSGWSRRFHDFTSRKAWPRPHVQGNPGGGR